MKFFLITLVVLTFCRHAVAVTRTTIGCLEVYENGIGFRPSLSDVAQLNQILASVTAGRKKLSRLAIKNNGEGKSVYLLINGKKAELAAINLEKDKQVSILEIPDRSDIIRDVKGLGFINNFAVVSKKNSGKLLFYRQATDGLKMAGKFDIRAELSRHLRLDREKLDKYASSIQFVEGIADRTENPNQIYAQVNLTMSPHVNESDTAIPHSLGVFLEPYLSQNGTFGLKTNFITGLIDVGTYSQSGRFRTTFSDMTKITNARGHSLTTNANTIALNIPELMIDSDFSYTQEWVKQQFTQIDEEAALAAQEASRFETFMIRPTVFYSNLILFSVFTPEAMGGYSYAGTSRFGIINNDGEIVFK